MLLFSQVDRVKTSSHIQPVPEARQSAFRGAANVECRHSEYRLRVRFAIWSPHQERKEKRKGEWRTQGKKSHWLSWPSSPGCFLEWQRQVSQYKHSSEESPICVLLLEECSVPSELPLCGPCHLSPLMYRKYLWGGFVSLPTAQSVFILTETATALWEIPLMRLLWCVWSYVGWNSIIQRMTTQTLRKNWQCLLNERRCFLSCSLLEHLVRALPFAL